MSAPSDEPVRTATAADLLAHRYSFDEHLQGCESAYRRGLHHGVNLASDLADDASTLAKARRTLIRAERVAGQHRSRRRHPGRPPIVDEIRRKLARKRRPAGAGSQ